MKIFSTKHLYCDPSVKIPVFVDLANIRENWGSAAHKFASKWYKELNWMLKEARLSSNRNGESAARRKCISRTNAAPDKTRFSTTKLPIEWIKLVRFDSFNPLYLFCGLTLRLSLLAIDFTWSTSLCVCFSLLRLIYWFLLIYRLHIPREIKTTSDASLSVHSIQSCLQWAIAFLSFYKCDVVSCTLKQTEEHLSSKENVESVNKIVMIGGHVRSTASK